MWTQPSGERGAPVNLRGDSGFAGADRMAAVGAAGRGGGMRRLRGVFPFHQPDSGAAEDFRRTDIRSGGGAGEGGERDLGGGRERAARRERAKPGWLHLKSGIVQVEFYTGARVLVEGPADFQLVSGSEAFCPSGRVSAEVPPQARGFVIRTPQMRVVDLRHRLRARGAAARRVGARLQGQGRNPSAGCAGARLDGRPGHAPGERWHREADGSESRGLCQRCGGRAAIGRGAAPSRGGLADGRRRLESRARLARPL